MILKSYNKFLEKEHKGSDYKYGCVVIYLDITNWAEIVPFINSEDIYHPEDTSKGLETSPHVTILYGLHDTVSDSDIKSVIEKIDSKKLKLKIKGIGIFENKDFDVVKFNVESDYLHQINSMFAKLPHSSDFQYNPHITIAYLKPGTARKYIDTSFEYNLPEINEIIYSKVNDEKLTFKI